MSNADNVDPEEALVAATSQRTRDPVRIDWFAMWAARAASTPTRIGAVGVLRVRMQSSQFERCALVPSATERTRISGSGVWRQGCPLRESSL